MRHQEKQNYLENDAQGEEEWPRSITNKNNGQ